MAEKKKKGNSASKSKEKDTKPEERQLNFFLREKKPYDENSMYHTLMPYCCFFTAVLSVFAFIFSESMNIIGDLAVLLQGLLGWGAWMLPVYLFIQGAMWKIDAPKGHIRMKAMCAFLFAVFVGAFVHMFFMDGFMENYEAIVESVRPNIVAQLFSEGKALRSGGILGGGLCSLLFGIGGKICVGLVTSVGVVIFGLFLFGWTINDAFRYSTMRAKELYYDAADYRRARKEQAELEAQRHEALRADRREAQLAEGNQRGHIDVDTPLDDDATGVGKKNVSVKPVKGKARNKLDVPVDDATGEYETVMSGASTLDDDDDGLELIHEAGTHGSEEVRKTGIVLTPEGTVSGGGAGDDEWDSLSANAEGQATGNNGEVPFPEDENLTDCDVFDSIISEKNPARVKTSSAKAEDNLSFADIFTDDATIAGAGTAIDSSAIVSGETGAEVQREFSASELDENGHPIAADAIDAESEDIDVGKELSPEKLYSFPPMSLLEEDPNPATFEVNEELKQTSVKLVETLASFGVRTKIMNICCGPAVTRYELKPDVGVKVRSIQNLADDIALHLSASGVRIEAPIPGKDAVGIEIPNKTRATVYIRNLIESEDFAEQKSRVSTCLGMDVAGSPVFMDIAKMPHLLIAGATGMGKSVCINSMIVSLLYKARPDEVKLILIDPKKVEFGMYNGIPHLLVPVVSDPKKAAGSLAWAVNEMEHRFSLIEAVGAREIKTYNKLVAGDPDRQVLPQIVIIIDELADLMMTAKDDVESSICRLAQKARAAGMHLIIGTQRPSVDVITGLIKANVPSRIAFTVASQVDSRTIIDIAGAERLMGRGDMLYAPVGCMKPMRVQGSWVSESEVEAIVEHLKGVGTVEYDTGIMESIEKEAMHCGEKKKKGGASSSDGEEGFTSSSREDILASDDMIFAAIELGLEGGQLSTSLIQRRLSLGYARAARILDKLTDLGFVSPFEGSKPRHMTITANEYMEIKMNFEEGRQ